MPTVTRRAPSGPSSDAARRDDAIGMAASASLALIALAGALVIIRGHTSQAVVALLLCCAVAAAGQIGGRAAGVAAAIAAAIGFNFFHTQPYLSLRIHDADDIWTTATLLLVGLVTGLGSDAGAVWRRTARRTAGELEAIERMTRAATSDTDTATSTATAEITGLLGLAACTFIPGPPPAGVTQLRPSGAVVGTNLVYDAAGFELPHDGVALVVARDGNTIGSLCCTPSPATGVSLDRRRAALAIADILGLALTTRASP